jgi:hypothetical protein
MPSPPGSRNDQPFGFEPQFQAAGRVRRQLGYWLATLAVLIYALADHVAGEDTLGELEEAAGA